MYCSILKGKLVFQLFIVSMSQGYFASNCANNEGRYPHGCCVGGDVKHCPINHVAAIG